MSHGPSAPATATARAREFRDSSGAAVEATGH
jgi:hypothetical protein